LLYCRLVCRLVPTFRRTHEFSSSPSQGGSHPEAVQLNLITGERVGRRGQNEPWPPHTLRGKMSLVRVNRPPQ